MATSRFSRFILFTFLVSIGALSRGHAQGRQDAEARALFQAGQVAFEDGRFESALDYFQRAYELSSRPGLLYNIATAADRLRQDRVALDAFERYLAADPNSQNRAEVQSRIQVLRRTLSGPVQPEPISAPEPARTITEVRASEEASIAPVPPSTPAGDAGPEAAPWILFGVGAAAAVTGIVLVSLAAVDVSTVENASQGSMWSSVQSSYDRSEPLSIAGFVCLGVGVAAIGGGLGWALGAPSAPRAEVALMPNGLSLKGSF